MKSLGTITLSNKVIVSDPCYSRGIRCNGELIIKPGEWETYLSYQEGRVSAITIIHNDYLSEYKKLVSEDYETIMNLVEEQPFEVGVDSGQAGIFCDTIYPVGNNAGEFDDKDSLYGKCCEATLGKGYEYQNRIWRKRKDIEDSKNLKALTPEMQERFNSDIEAKESDLEVLLDKDNFIERVQGGLVDGKGIVSCSGDGDGGYSCFTIKKDEDIVYIKIQFLYADE